VDTYARTRFTSIRDIYIEGLVKTSAQLSEAMLAVFCQKTRVQKIFDIGCGYGSLLYFLLKEGYKNAGSCVTRVHRAITHTHPLNQLGCDPLRIDPGCIPGHIEMQVSRMDPAEGAQIGPQGCAGSFIRVAVHLTRAIAIIIPRPLVHAVADSRVAWMAPARALPLIGIAQGAAPRKVLRDQRRAGARMGMVADPSARLPRLARDQTNDGGTIMVVGPVPVPLMGAPPGLIGAV
jgi:hypothetical protein